MKYKLTDLKSKEVIDTKTGIMLGRIDDIEFNTEDPKIESFIIYGRVRLFGLLGRDDDIVLRYSDIDLIGKDTVLISNHSLKGNTPGREAVFSFGREKIAEKT